MRFGVSYGNHADGGVHVEDAVVYVRNALRAAGQEAYMLPDIRQDGVNVLIECFTPEHAWQIHQIKKRYDRARFVIVVSEVTDGIRFNSHITSGEGHYVAAEYWKKRFDLFLDVASEADAIWSVSDYTLPGYRALFPDKPVVTFPIGFDPFFPFNPHPLAEQKDIDLLFTGSPTPHRNALLSELSKNLTVMSASPRTLTTARLDLIGRTKACLHLNLQKHAVYSSVLRHHFLVMAGAPVVSERAETDGPLDEFIEVFDGSEFVARTVDYLRRDEWKHAGLAARERYREARPVAEAVKQVLRQSFA
jgi:hypothetical protein